MIKTVVRNIINKNDRNLNPNISQEAFFSIECNYNGLIYEINHFYNNFKFQKLKISNLIFMNNPINRRYF